MAKKMPEMEDYKYGFRDEHKSIFQSGKGLTREIVEEISRIKNEPEWMLEFRLKSLSNSSKCQCHVGAATWMTWISMISNTMFSHPRSKVKHGKKFLQKLKKHSISLVSLKRSKSSLLVYLHSMNLRLFITACRKSLKIKVLSSQIRIQHFVNTRSCSDNISERSFLQQITNSRH